MSDLRHDPIDDHWVAMAGNRRTRPMEFIPNEQIRKQIICPFCKGNEDETPTTIQAYRSDGTTIEDPLSDDWLTRVVANKYPSFSTLGDPQLDADNPAIPVSVESPTGTFANPLGSPHQINRSPGVQELIIPTPRHLTSISELSDCELEVSFVAKQDRILATRDQTGIEHAMLFLNCRSAAGASLGHLHWQLIGTPLISPSLRRRCERDDASRTEFGESLISRLTTWELGERQRVVVETKRFAVICPFASRFPFQIRIVPRDCRDSFLSLDGDWRFELANICRDMTRRLETILDQPAYNVLLHTPPFKSFPAGADVNRGSQFQQDWYFEIFPRLTITAGFEWGTGVWVNPITPETATKALRAATT